MIALCFTRCWLVIRYSVNTLVCSLVYSLVYSIDIRQVGSPSEVFLVRFV